MARQFTRDIVEKMQIRQNEFETPNNFANIAYISKLVQFYKKGCDFDIDKTAFIDIPY